MMKKAILMAAVAVIAAVSANAQENTITISGRVTDFDGRPIDRCEVSLGHADFTEAYTAVTDKDGYYSMPNVEKGKYASLCVMRPEEYPRPPMVPEEDMRLEYWAWNIIADRDLTINPRYHRLELYGTTVFKSWGGYPGMIIYTRPMSLGRHISYGEAMYGDKSASEAAQVDISAEPEDISFQVWADDVPLTVRSVQPVDEWVGGGRQKAYLIYVDNPTVRADRFRIFRVAAFNSAQGGEWGENACFYELPDYVN
jgi:hypothetical protein